MIDDATSSDAREVAEEAREGAREQPSFAAELFLGTLRPDLLLPWPPTPPDQAAETDAFLARLARVLSDHVDPDAVDRDGHIPDAAVAALEAVGAFRMKASPDVGGLGLSQRDYGRALGLVGSYCGSTAVLLSGHQSIGVGTPLKLFGTEEQKARYLPRLAAGALSGFALTEADAGSDPARMTTTAVPAPDGNGWILDGEKLWCTNGPAADLLVVMARTPDEVVEGRPRRRISAFLVETAWDGVDTVQECRFMGYRGIRNGRMRFKQVRVPQENLLWGEGRGLKLALVTLNTGRLTLPATNAAVARQCVQIVRRWAGERRQWGAAIGEHEAVAVTVGWIASHAYAMSAMADWSAALADRGDVDIRIEAALAKLFCSEIGFQVVDRTLRVRGGRGYETADSLRARGETAFPVERLFREARLNTIVEGSSEILHLFLAREALDPHLRRAGAVLDPDASVVRKTLGFVTAGTSYLGFYLSRCVPTFGVPADVPAALRSHWAFARRGARRLARRIMRSMLRHGPGLEHRQALLGRHVDDGADLVAMSVAIACASSTSAAEDVELADVFCRHARARIRDRQAAATTLDQRGRQLGIGVIEGRYRRLEEGILPYESEG